MFTQILKILSMKLMPFSEISPILLVEKLKEKLKEITLGFVRIKTAVRVDTKSSAKWTIKIPIDN